MFEMWVCMFAQQWLNLRVNGDVPSTAALVPVCPILNPLSINPHNPSVYLTQWEVDPQ